MKRGLLILGLLLPAPALAQHQGHAGAQPAPSPPPATSPAEHEGHSGAPAAPGHVNHAEMPGATPPGYAEVQVAPDRQQLIGLKVASAEKAKIAGAVRATAIIQPDETKEAHIHTKLSGWVQELYVNAVGQQVKKGQPLYSLYSQDLFAAEQELLQARRTTPDLAQAARKRLQLWDVPDDQIRLIEQKGPQKTVLFRSPVGGTVIEKSVLQGHFVEPGAMLYRIADLSQVWIIASAYEYEVNRIDKSGTATIDVQGVPTPVRAQIDYVYPTVDPSTRTVKVRLVAPNPEGTLRPGSYATVELPTLGAEAIWVPEDALIDTGVRQIVYLAKPQGHFQPVLVRAGRHADGKVEILEGLEPSAQVVVSAQFLIDSESRIRGAGQPGGHAGHGG